MLLEIIPTNDAERPTILIGDTSRGLAILIDPGDNVQSCIRVLDQHQLQLRQAFATHDANAVYRSLIELKKSTGAGLFRSGRLDQVMNITPVFDGSLITLGKLRLHVSLDPDNRAHMTIRVFELLQSGSARLVITAGSVAA